MFESNLKESKLNEITKDEILKHITQEDIFQRYLGIVPTYRPIKSPLRQDKHADCGFYVNSANVIKYYDKAKFINDDCFGIVKLIYNIDFNQALLLIANDFGLLASINASVPYREHITKEQILQPRVTKIEIQTRPFTKEDLDYWIQFNITEELLKKEKVFAVKTAWVNDTISSRVIYNYIKGDICFAYTFPENKTIKLYLPQRRKTEKRFFAETDLFPLSGYKKLSTTGDYVIITKSKKDELCIKSFDIKNVCSTQNEGGIINRDIITDLYNRFDNIFVLFDYDKTGIKCTKLNKIQYPFIRPLFIRDKSKDISGYCKKYGINKTEEIINKFKEYVKQFIY